MSLKHETMNNSKDNREASNWDTVAAMADNPPTDMSGEKHESVPEQHKTLETHKIKRTKSNEDIAAKLSSAGFEEKDIRYHSFPSWGGHETGALNVYNVKGDLALQYTVFSDTEEDKQLYDALLDRKAKLEQAPLTFIELPPLYGSVDIFDDNELQQAESDARSIEKQSDELYNNAVVAGEYKIIDFTNLASKDSAQHAENIIRQEKVFNAPNKEAVKMIFLKKTDTEDYEDTPYMDVEVVQPKLDPVTKSVEQSILPYNVDINQIKKTGYGTGGIHGVPITEKEKLIQAIQDSYEKEHNNS